MSYYLGIDLGTSGLKAVLMNPEGEICGLGTRAYGIDIPQPGYAEQSPERWWKALCEAVHEAVAHSAVQIADIRAIGLSGQMHGTVLLDQQGQPLCPAIIWCDQRSIDECRTIFDTVGFDRLGEWTQNRVSPGFLAASLLWVRNHRPELYRDIRHVLLPKDYLRYRLTDRYASEATDASGTLLFDCARGDWSQPMFDALGFDPALFPDARHTSYEIGGELTTEAAKALGLNPGIPVVYGGGDQPMQAVAGGVLRPGDASITIGTGGQILLPTDSPLYDPMLRTHTFRHVGVDRWYVMGATLNACLSLNWFMEKVLNTQDVQAFDAKAGKVKPGCEGLLFLPYLTGERTPHMDPKARGAFFGLSLHHGRDEMSRAVLEGVAYSLLDAMQVILDLELPLHRLIISGGGARSLLWRQIIADVFDRPLHTSRMREESGVGAAICAMVGAGEYPSLEAACDRIVRYEEAPVEPNPERAAIYRARYGVYRQIYHANKEIFAAL